MTISVTQADIDASSKGILTNALALALNRLYPTYTNVAFVDVAYIPPAKAIVEAVEYNITNLDAIIAVLVQNTLDVKPNSPFTAELVKA